MPKNTTKKQKEDGGASSKTQEEEVQLSDKELLFDARLEPAQEADDLLRWARENMDEDDCTPDMQVARDTQANPETRVMARVFSVYLDLLNKFRVLDEMNAALSEPGKSHIYFYRETEGELLRKKNEALVVAFEQVLVEQIKTFFGMAYFKGAPRDVIFDEWLPSQQKLVYTKNKVWPDQFKQKLSAACLREGDEKTEAGFCLFKKFMRIRGGLEKISSFEAKLFGYKGAAKKELKTAEENRKADLMRQEEEMKIHEAAVRRCERVLGQPDALSKK